MINDNSIYSVTDINRYIKNLLVNNAYLQMINIKGEISNLRRGPNGHFYFVLKDEFSLINAIMFSTYASKIDFPLKDGDEVLVRSSIDAYTPRGTYQLNVYDIEPLGLGNELLKFERLKKQLAEEGLFDVSRKLSINIFPKAIGVITAKNSAAIKDILFNLKRRYPVADIYVFYASVQGENAPKELLKAFLLAQDYELDTLIIGRGGGASEDLSAFNDEILVRAISKSKIPVISAVGHEINSTLVDFVADKRASTPTGAAELATVDRREIEKHLVLSLDTMKESLQRNFKTLSENLSKEKIILCSCFNKGLTEVINQTINYKERLNRSIKDYINNLNNNLHLKKETLEALNPTNVLKRGYGIISLDSGTIVQGVEDIKENDIINIQLQNGLITSRVEKVRK